jgi:N-acetylglutamate synthase-like GNAT family acetyltransferase
VLAKEIAAELGLDAGYLSRTIARFEQAGWVSRKRGDDARQRPVRLTQQGRAAFDAMDRDTRASMAALIEPLSQDQRRQLSAALATVEQMLGGTGSGEVTLRVFRPGDMGQITARQSILYSEIYGWGVGMEALIGEITAGFLRNFQPGREQCWIAERDGRMLGCVFLVSDSTETARLRLLYVEAEARGLGIGNLLVEQCVNFARDAGYRELVLWTHTVLDSARKIYAAHGFEITSVDVHHEFGKPEQGESWRLVL